MNDSLTQLAKLRRPPLLIQAARIGVADYNRQRHLRRLLKDPRLPGPREAILRLLEEESALNDTRLAGMGQYNVTQHVDVMIALIGEALLIKSPAEENAPG